METTRQKKVSKLIQKDIANILREKLKKHGSVGVLVSVTKVSVSADFSVAKVFLSIFPFEMSKQVLGEVSKISSRIRHEISQKAKKQLTVRTELWGKAKSLNRVPCLHGSVVCYHN